ncbi:hypothetical protein yrohd0001_14250 [Yersinia rohdei ATCC 43380]|nr:hypothetical protein yrohd0001_14250 [Yersinia rohdei ATCC 43380]
MLKIYAKTYQIILLGVNMVISGGLIMKKSEPDSVSLSGIKLS